MTEFIKLLNRLVASGSMTNETKKQILVWLDNNVLRFENKYLQASSAYEKYSMNLVLARADILDSLYRGIAEKLKDHKIGFEEKVTEDKVEFTITIMVFK